MTFTRFECNGIEFLKKCFEFYLLGQIIWQLVFFCCAKERSVCVVLVENAFLSTISCRSLGSVSFPYMSGVRLYVLNVTVSLHIRIFLLVHTILAVHLGVHAQDCCDCVWSIICR